MTRDHGTVKSKRAPWDRAGSGVRTVAGGLLPLYRALCRRCRPATERGARLARRLWWLPGWVLAAVTLLPALIAIAWLLPGTGMLLAGRLLPAPMLIIFVPLAVALCYFAMRQLPVSWPRFTDPDEPAGAGMTGPAVPGRNRAPAWALLGTVAIAAGFGAWQAAFRSGQLFAVSDPSVYLQYGYWIAKHAAVRIPASATAFGGAGGLAFASPGFHVSGGSITPDFMPGLPLVLAAGTWLGGLGGALLMPPVLGGCAVLSFGGLTGRLCGPRWAPAGALVLALSLPEVYVSRTPFSEPLVQVLLFGGLCMLTDSLVVRRRMGVPPPLLGGIASSGGLALAGLAGLALGLTVLAGIGSLGLLLPAFPVLAVLFVARWPQAGPFGTGLFLGIGLGLAVGLTLARSYLSTLSSQLHLFGLGAAGFGVVTALAAPLAFPAARSRLRRVLRVQVGLGSVGRSPLVLPSLGTVLQVLAVGVPAGVLIVLAVRPYFQIVRGQLQPTVTREIAELQRIAGLPVNGRRQYYEQSLNWVLWYLGVPAVLLGFAGAALIGRRCVRAALDLRPSLREAAPGPAASQAGASQAAASAVAASAVAARAWVLPLLVTGWSVVTVLWDPFVAPWQPWASHRLVPVVLPGLVLLAVWTASRLTGRASRFGASRVISASVACCTVLALAIPPLVTTFNPGLAPRASVGRNSSGLSKFLSRVRLRGVGASATYRGSVSAAWSLCAAIGQDASVVFTDANTAARFAPVVRGLCGQPAATVRPGASPLVVERIVTSIERVRRHPVLIGDSRRSVLLFGVVPRKVVSLHTAGDAEVLTGPPAGTWPTSYVAWLASPLGAGPASLPTS